MEWTNDKMKEWGNERMMKWKNEGMNGWILKEQTNERRNVQRKKGREQKKRGRNDHVLEKQNKNKQWTKQKQKQKQKNKKQTKIFWTGFPVLYVTECKIEYKILKT